MKKLLLLICMAGMFAIPISTFPATELITSTSQLVVDRGNMLDIKSGEGAFIRIRTPVEKLWKIVLINKNSKRELELTPGDGYSMQTGEGSIAFIMKEKRVEGVTMDAHFTITVKDDAFCFSGCTRSKSEDWIIKDVIFPCFDGIQFNDQDVQIYWPQGLGACFRDPEHLGNRSQWYPSAEGIAMPWFSVNSTGTGLYVGSHDSLQDTKIINLSHNKSTGVIQSEIKIPVNATAFDIPDVMVRSYRGEWYEASGSFYTQMDR